MFMDIEISICKEKYDLCYLKNGRALIRVKACRYLRCFIYTLKKLQCLGMQVTFIFHVLKMRYAMRDCVRECNTMWTYYAVSIIGSKYELGMKAVLLCLPPTCLAYSSALKVEAIHSSKMSTMYQTI
jgi:hypothetical protein